MGKADLMSKEDTEKLKKKKMKKEEKIMNSENPEELNTEKENLLELTEVELLKEEISVLKEQLKESKNDYLKAYADTENTKKRLQRESEVMRKYRIQSFAFEVLPVLDNLERALNQDSNDASFKNGIQMIYDQLVASLSEEGVVAIKAVDQEFDPNIHQAMMTEEIEGVEPNIVVAELQKGYMLKDRVLRASYVKVSK